MIVSCPGCSTHYSHQEDDVLRIGRCSQCDERFALSAPKRRYVVMPAMPSGGADPLLAAGLAETRTQVDRPADTVALPGLPKSMEVGDFPLPSSGATDEDEGFFGPDLNDDEALFGMDDVSEEAAEAGEGTAEEAPAATRPAHPIREILGVFMLAGLGSAAGYHGSLQFGFEPLNAIGVGLGLGLTFGWAWIRWAERKR